MAATRDEVQQYLALGTESRRFEVKGPGSRKDKHYCAVVAQAVMAMGNLRDGGYVCLGIDNRQLPTMLPGLTAELLIEWSAVDDVHDALGRYCDPPASFAVLPMTLDSGADVVILDVDEFDLIPHVAKRDYPNIIRSGALYVRPRGKPRTEIVPNALEMRDLLDLATDKAVREFLRRATAAGLPLAQVASPAELERELFANEAAAAWGEPSQIMASTQSHAHFEVMIRPEPYANDRLSVSQLEQFVQARTVQLRGWPVPFIDGRIPMLRFQGAIGQDIEARVVPQLEAWRLCTSGQFMHRRVLAFELERADALRTPDGAQGAVAVWDVLLYMVEVAEFAARTLTDLQATAVNFDVSLVGIANYQLISGDYAREIFGPYVWSSARMNSTRTFEASAVLADARSVGVALAQSLLQKFGLNVSDQLLLDYQSKTFDRQ